MVKRSSIPAATMPGQIPQIHTWYTALYLTNQAQFDEMHTCTVHTSFLAHFEYVVWYFYNEKYSQMFAKSLCLLATR